MTTTSQKIHEQVQAGIDARTSMDLPLGAGLGFSRARTRMLGLDRERTSVEDAARLAFTPTGPPVEVLEAQIRELRREAGIAA